MSSANLEVVFEGPAVKAGSIDARLLAERAGAGNYAFASKATGFASKAFGLATAVATGIKGGFYVACAH